MALKHYSIACPRPVDPAGAVARNDFQRSIAALCGGFHNVEHEGRRLAPDGSYIGVHYDWWHIVIEPSTKAAVQDFLEAYLNVIGEPLAEMFLPSGDVETVTCGV